MDLYRRAQRGGNLPPFRIIASNQPGEVGGTTQPHPKPRFTLPFTRQSDIERLFEDPGTWAHQKAADVLLWERLKAKVRPIGWVMAYVRHRKAERRLKSAEAERVAARLKVEAEKAAKVADGRMGHDGMTWVAPDEGRK